MTLALVATSGGALAAQPSPPAGHRSAAQATGCEQPYEPWFQAYTYPEQTAVPDLGAPINYGPAPDTDGDGTPDTIVDAGNGGTYTSMTITRGDGVITITPGSHTYVYLDRYGLPPGDLDGDGRDELLIGVDQQGQQYVLPGTTAPGTHAIDDVGIFTDTTLDGTVPVGDQNADGNGDVAGAGASEVQVLSGAEIMAPGPGGTLGPLTALVTYPGSNVTAAVLSPGAVPTIVTGHVISDGVTLTVRSAPPVDLVAHDVHTAYTGGVGTIGVYQHDGATFVSQSASDRSGSSVAVWNLTDPCSRYVALAEGSAPAEPEATPAAAVDGTAGYTG